ncbi:TPA: transfer complex protein TraA [Staphylococcus aureus]|uniref:conjugative transfer protein TrsA n=1 Tax=Staphylococcus capitis TaxID=29388 RepID=UPI0018C7A6BA|nr:transfer complex protein TraA [Staphylococcus aureus]HAY1011888.1 transfer complex protein TraA [Staphylococcus aureus]HCV2138966.1 transfer complex protein TraA [Staphylococcus aureus]HCY8983443.1 transfer complex protein TraA [Staphylococcus aureus]
MDNIAMRKLIEQHRRKYQQQRNFYDEQNYKSRFGIKDDEIRSFNVKGIATDRQENKLVMAEDKQDNQKLLLYANKNNDMYYLNSGNSYKEAVQNTFGKSSNYEMVDDNLFIYNSQKQALTNYSQLDNYHNKQEELQYDRKLQEERKRVLTDPQTIHNQAKEDLALSLGLTATALKGEINVTSIEDVTDSEEMITIENEITGKDEHLISNFKDSFSEKIKEGLNVSPSVKLGFEEFKNASLQIAMGFTEFYGARYDESTLERDPKVVVDENGYSLSTFDKDGNKKDLASTDTFEEAVKLSKKLKQDNNLDIDSKDLEHELQRSK